MFNKAHEYHWLLFCGNTSDTAAQGRRLRNRCHRRLPVRLPSSCCCRPSVLVLSHTFRVPHLRWFHLERIKQLGSTHMWEWVISKYETLPVMFVGQLAIPLQTSRLGMHNCGWPGHWKHDSLRPPCVKKKVRSKYLAWLRNENEIWKVSASKPC